ncbi:MAG: hypothetical protein AB7N80_06790 [Bdellovibrionales bacterium]
MKQKLAGVTADLLGLDSAIWLIAIITAFSGFFVAFRMKETLKTCIETPVLEPN